VRWGLDGEKLGVWRRDLGFGRWGLGELMVFFFVFLLWVLRNGFEEREF